MQQQQDFDVELDNRHNIPNLPVNPEINPTAVRSCAGTPEFFVQVALCLESKPVIQNSQAQDNKIVDKLHDFSEMQIINNVPRNNLILVFNKYNVVKRHYLLVAAEFRHQLEIIQKNVFQEVFSFLQTYPTMTAIFNGGRHAGSSQPRQHFQLLQLDPDMPLFQLIQQQHQSSQKIKKISPFQNKKHGVVCIKTEYDDNESFVEFSAESLYENYLELLKVNNILLSKPINRLELQQAYPLNPYEQFETLDYVLDDNEQNQTQITLHSYSLFITTDFMFLTKRLCENGFNTIAFSGYAFAKDQYRADQIEHQGLYNLLRETLEDE